MDSYKDQEQKYDDFAFAFSEKNVEEYSNQQNSYLNDSMSLDKSFSEDMLDDSNRNPETSKPRNLETQKPRNPET